MGVYPLDRYFAGPPTMSGLILGYGTATLPQVRRAAAVLSAARDATAGSVIAVVQPHRYSRLANLFNEFCTCFNDADAVVVADVYPAGEAPIEGASRDALVEGLRARGHRKVLPLASPSALAATIDSVAKPGDLVVCLGAGSITQWAYALPAELAALGGQTGGR